MAFVERNPAGGYTVTRDDGSSFLSAMPPPGLAMQGAEPPSAAPPPPALNPDIAAAAMPGPDNRVAGPGGGFDLAQSVMDRAGVPERNPDAAVPAALPRGTLDVPGLSAPGGAPGYLTRPTDPARPPPAAPQGVSGPPQMRPQANAPMQEAPQQLGSPYRVIKGGERKAGETMVQTSYGPQEDALKANLKRGEQNEYQAVEGLRDATAVGQGDAADHAAAQATWLEANRRQNEAAEAKRQESIAQDQQKFQRIQAESQREVDPGRLWANRSSGDKAMGVLAVALGALGAGLQGRGGNDVMAMYQKEIDDDINAQKFNIEQSGKRLEQQRGALADNMRIFGDQRQAELATRQQYLEAGLAQAQSIAGKAKTEEDKQRAGIALAKLQQESAKNSLEFDKTTHQVHTVVTPDRVVGGPTAEEGLNRSLVVQDLDGTKHLARDEKGATEIRTKRPIAQNVIDASNRMRQIADMPGFDKLDPSSPLVNEFNRARETFINGTNALEGQNMVHQDDIDRYTKTIISGPYGLATARLAQTFAAKTAQAYKNIYNANADTETRVREGAEIDPRTHQLRKGAHYDSGDLLRGAPQSSGVTFTPAGKR